MQLLNSIRKQYPALDNEFGVVNENFEYGDIRRYGGVGDGVTDDSDAIVNAFKSQKTHPEIILKFEKNKTYICRKSPTIAPYSYLEGNGATIKVDRIEGYLANQIQFFWDNGYQGHIEIVNWENLNIDFSPELLQREETGKSALIWIFKIYDCEEFRMKNVNVVYNGDERNLVNLFTFEGHGKIFMENCYFKNTMRAKENGSIIWLQSKLADGYYARIKNCHFYTNTWDEAVSCFCSGTHDVVIDGCTIEKYWYDTYYDNTQELNQTFCGYFITNNYLNPTTFTDEEISQIYQNVVYQNCKLICKPVDEESTIGILGLTAFGNVYPTPSMLKFVNCDIEIANLDQLVMGDSKNNYTNNIDWCNNSNVVFDNCTMKLSKFKHNRGILRSNAANITIQNSKMELERYLYNQLWIEANKCTCHKLVMDNNTVYVTNTNGVLFTVHPLAKEQYIITNNEFIVTDETGDIVDVPLLKEETANCGYETDAAVFYHEENAVYRFHSTNNRINGKVVSGEDDMYDIVQSYINNNPVETKFVYVWEKQNLDIVSGLIGVNGGADYSAQGYHAYAVVTPGMLLKICAYTYSSNKIYPAYTFLDSNDAVVDYFGEANTTYTDLEVIVPEGATRILINHNISLKLTLHIRQPKNIDDYVLDCFNASSVGMKYDLDQAYKKNELLAKNNDFQWGTFDKAYFCFVIDDCNEHLEPTYDLFHEKGVPLSVAAITNYLTYHHNGDSRSVKDVLKLVEADGGEILAHYYGNLAEEGYAGDGTHTFLTSEADWLSKTRDVKKEFEENGFTIRGIIRADYTLQNTTTGEKYCRKYFEYSDGLGTSTQYNMKRTFFSSFSTIDALKAKIDTQVATPGFYPYCLHGTETCASIENLTEIIDYILAKGDGVAFTTYADVYDSIGTNSINTEIKEKTRSVLDDKTIVFLGDSITVGMGWQTEISDTTKSYGWAHVIQENHPTANVRNLGISGACIAETGRNMDVVAQYTAMTTPTNELFYVDDPDYIIFSGGGNDAFMAVDQGTMLDAFDFNPVYDNVNTTIGALEFMFMHAYNNYPNARKGFIITQKLTAEVEVYYELIRQVCDKWAIPILDLSKVGEVNPYITGVVTEFFNGEDRIHPNQKCYREILAPKVEKWIENELL